MPKDAVLNFLRVLSEVGSYVSATVYENKTFTNYLSLVYLHVQSNLNVV